MEYTTFLMENLLTSKKFVATTQDLTNYLGMVEHYKDMLITDDVIKYGRENFCVEILSKHRIRKNATKAKTKYIKKFNCIHPNGYNKNLGPE